LCYAAAHLLGREDGFIFIVAQASEERDGRPAKAMLQLRRGEHGCDRALVGTLPCGWGKLSEQPTRWERSIVDRASLGCSLSSQETKHPASTVLTRGEREQAGGQHAAWHRALT